jgi:hypothetical protein
MSGLMVTAVYRAFIEAGVERETAEAAAEAVPAREVVASKEDLAQMEARMVKWGVALVAVAVALNNFLQWVIR